MVWYSHLFQNFPQFVVIHTVKGFGIVNSAEVDVFLELSCLFDVPADIGNLISGLGRSPREGKGYPLQYSGLENSMDCIIHMGHKESDTTESLSLSN